ncbi:type III-A CRISPR-associated protein Csm2 [Crenalkalicoccus roseus]|uniref:type III-A CRISPR-associated protein Csm2 n=1 Tax=Crenalkalicoccus roseus TaxID=1485588 RepID=UPI00108202A4|nr:type III-A CRISPR-associated protein Csm2 [Crenalkalicoccus roseus]
MSGHHRNHRGPGGGPSQRRFAGTGGLARQPATGPGHAAPPAGGEDARGRIEDLLRPPAQKLCYFADNDRKVIDANLLGSKAEEVARKLAEVPASQLRRFYAEVMALKRRAELAGASDAEVRAQLMLLRAKAAYTWARQKSYPDELVLFFTRHAASVETRHDFLRGFQPHFEAVMAFHRVFGKKKDAA